MSVTFTEDNTEQICLSTNSHLFQRIGLKQISFGIYIKNVSFLMILRYGVINKLSSGFLSTFSRLYTAQRINYLTLQVNARFYSHQCLIKNASDRPIRKPVPKCKCFKEKGLCLSFNHTILICIFCRY